MWVHWLGRGRHIEREILISVLIKLPNISQISIENLFDEKIKNTHWRCMKDERSFSDSEICVVNPYLSHIIQILAMRIRLPNSEKNDE